MKINASQASLTTSIARPFVARYGILALSLAFVALAPSAWAQKLWIGATGNGGDGDWVAGNFNPSGLPNTGTSGSANQVHFDNASGNQQVESVVTIRTGVAARARALTVRNNKMVTIQLEDNSSLTVNDQTIGVGGGTTVQGDMSLSFNGPTSGTAALTGTRFYLEGDNINVGTSYSKSLILSGNLAVNLIGSFSAVNGRASITVLDGVSITTNAGNTSSDFYIRAGGKDVDSNVFDNRMSFLGGSVAAKNFFVASVAGGVSGSGLLQLGAGARITKATGADELKIELRTGGRFEAAGSGLSQDALIDVQGGGTFAVGLTDQTTGVRAGAESFTLNGIANFAANSSIEFSFFGSGANEADHIVIGENGILNNLSTGAQLALILANGFVPTYGDSWSLFSVDPLSDGIVGNFDISLVDQSLWDLSNFNQSGGWVVTAIPEPSALGLFGLAGVIASVLARRRNK